MGDKRSRLIIKGAFQKSMILEFLLVMFILINLIVICSYLLIDSFADVQLLKRYLGFSVAGLEIAGFIIAYRINLKASHRIAGPVYVIERCLRWIEQGDLTFTMRLRQGDQFHEVKDQMNDSVVILRKHIARSQALAQQLKERLPATGGEVALVDKLVRELSYFKTEIPPEQESSPAGESK